MIDLSDVRTSPLTEAERELMADVLHRGQRADRLVPVSRARFPFTPIEAARAQPIGPVNPRAMRDRLTSIAGLKTPSDLALEARLKERRAVDEAQARADRAEARRARLNQQRKDRREADRQRSVRRAAERKARAEQRRAAMEAAKPARGTVVLRSSRRVLHVVDRMPRHLGDYFEARFVGETEVRGFRFRPELHELGS